MTKIIRVRNVKTVHNIEDKPCQRTEVRSWGWVVDPGSKSCIPFPGSWILILSLSSWGFWVLDLGL